MSSRASVTNWISLIKAGEQAAAQPLWERSFPRLVALARARLRGAFVKRAKERRRDFTVDWVHLKLNDQAQRTVLRKDPFKSHDERVERLIQSL